MEKKKTKNSNYSRGIRAGLAIGILATSAVVTGYNASAQAIQNSIQKISKNIEDFRHTWNSSVGVIETKGTKAINDVSIKNGELYYGKFKAQPGEVDFYSKEQIEKYVKNEEDEKIAMLWADEYGSMPSDEYKQTYNSLDEQVSEVFAKDGISEEEKLKIAESWIERIEKEKEDLVNNSQIGE